MYVWEKLHVRAQILWLCARQAIFYGFVLHMAIRATIRAGFCIHLPVDSTRRPRANCFLARARASPAARARPAISHNVNLVRLCGNGFPPILLTHSVTCYDFMQLSSVASVSEPYARCWDHPSAGAGACKAGGGLLVYPCSGWWPTAPTAHSATADSAQYSGLRYRAGPRRSAGEE